ncbi:MAG: ABC transporter ATP-binding protein [Chloroflexi bacterium]|nr:ABC transporter ATP-binding protein [Chloroflexota bacterium]
MPDASSAAVELRDVVKRFGDVVAVDHVSLRIAPGEFFALLGPSGSGKTTTLRMIGGFELPTEGEVLIEGEPQGYKPPYQRPVNTVFQNYALFPHMTVAQNIAFGLEMRGVPKEEIRRRVSEMLDLVRLSGYERRRPHQLSGGEQQRVALARALINRPKVLLLDEPLGALDLKLRKAMQLELKAIQEQVGITFIYVTHDQEEAITMANRIAVMNKGKVLQVGTPQEVYEQPQTFFVADFIGDTNFLPVQVMQVTAPVEVMTESGTRLTASWAEPTLRTGVKAVMAVRPERMHLYRPGSGPEGPEWNRVEGIIRQVIYKGLDIRYEVFVAGECSLHVRMPVGRSEGTFQRGEHVIVAWPRAAARVFRSES